MAEQRSDWFSLAYAQVGKPYIWGSGSGAGGRGSQDIDPATGQPKGFDCSGFVSYIYKQGLGVDLPAFTGTAYTASRGLREQEDPRPGDLVFWNMGNPDPKVQHIGVYVGGGKVLQSGGAKGGVNLDNVSSNGPPTFRRVDRVDQRKIEAAYPVITQTLGVPLPKVGANTVSTSPEVVTYTNQVNDLRKKVEDQRAKVEALALAQDFYYGPDSTLSRTAWLQKKGLTEAQLSQALQRAGVSGQGGKNPVGPNVETIADERKRLDTLEGDLRTVEGQLASAQGDAGKPPTASSQYLNTDSSDQFILQRNPDGTLKLDASGKPITIPNPNYKPAKDTSGRDAVDLETAQANLARARLLLIRETDPIAQRQRQVELDAAELALRRAVAAAERETDPTAVRLRQIELAKGELALETGQLGLERGRLELQREQQPEIVSAPATQEFIVTRQADGSFKSEPNPAYKAPRADIVNAPTTQRQIVERTQEGDYRTVDNPAYQTPAPPALADPAAQYQQQATFLQAQARAERDRLRTLEQSKAITPEEAASRFNHYWATQVMAPLEGLRMQAENQRAEQARKQETEQRAENVRVEGINRERERIGYQAGQDQRAAAAKLAPEIRSPAYLGNVAEQLNRWGQGDFSGVQWTPQMFQPAPGQIPNLDALAQQETARALAAISPAAAAKIGGPLPAPLPALPDITRYM